MQLIQLLENHCPDGGQNDLGDVPMEPELMDHQQKWNKYK